MSPIPRWRVVGYSESNGRQLQHQCLMCYQIWLDNCPSDFGWHFCPYCGTKWEGRQYNTVKPRIPPGQPGCYIIQQLIGWVKRSASGSPHVPPEREESWATVETIVYAQGEENKNLLRARLRELMHFNGSEAQATKWIERNPEIESARFSTFRVLFVPPGKEEAIPIPVKAILHIG